MLTFRFQKTGPAAFIPHVDTLRHIIRTIRRAGIRAAYSQGFNPHMSIYLSPPMPLGFQSLCEYCTVDTDVPADEFTALYNSRAVKGMECLGAVNVSKNPNIAAAAAAALYEIECPALWENFGKISGGSFTALVKKDGEAVQKDVTEDVLDIRRTDKGIAALLRFGNMGNLRIDRFLEALRARLEFEGESVIKTQLFCRDKEGRIIPAESYLSAFKI